MLRSGDPPHIGQEVTPFGDGVEAAWVTASTATRTAHFMNIR
jgi:hypothetical protein